MYYIIFQILNGIDRSVVQARALLESLKSRCHPDNSDSESKLIRDKTEIENVKLENTFSNITR